MVVDTLLTKRRDFFNPYGNEGDDITTIKEE